MSVLAHVFSESSAKETTATQALAYILNSYPDSTKAVVSLLDPAGVTFEPIEVVAEPPLDSCRPDLAIKDSKGRMRVLIENKFDADLRSSQPVQYLAHLDKDFPSALLFIVPEHRVEFVWSELIKRCRQNQESWGVTKVVDKDGMRWAQANSKILAIAHWSHVLSSMLRAMPEAVDHIARNDIYQLKGLTDMMEQDAFLPLEEYEVSGQQFPRRLNNYIDLVKRIVERLKLEELADTEGCLCRWFDGGVGQFMHLQGREPHSVLYQK